MWYKLLLVLGLTLFAPVAVFIRSTIMGISVSKKDIIFASVLGFVISMGGIIIDMIRS